GHRGARVEDFPGDDDRVPVTEAAMVVMKRRVLVLPDDVSGPVQLHNRAAGTAKGPGLLAGGAAEQEVAVGQEVAVVGFEGRRGAPASYFVARWVDKVCFVAG